MKEIRLSITTMGRLAMEENNTPCANFFDNLDQVAAVLKKEDNFIFSSPLYLEGCGDHLKAPAGFKITRRPEDETDCFTVTAWAPDKDDLLPVRICGLQAAYDKAREYLSPIECGLKQSGKFRFALA